MEALRNGNVKEVYKSGLNLVTEKLNSLDLSNNNSSISNNDCRFPKSAPSRLSSGEVFFSFEYSTECQLGKYEVSHHKPVFLEWL
ncbi:hypothetical protein NECAME_13303 [Necator americanus]|uniref:Uncharacterized protein n=1 Tax=Necator americanus TaxID=51031 RepID=W2SWR0_NECAM|nr:hypothetical protein NECAME_13303 [Necator americanus]ETN73943.1 hypothetical protein NECAME_13303 [Necator americanus]